jgi:chromosome segregation ATPase
MTEEREPISISSLTEGTPRWMGIAVVVLAAVSLLALGVGWNASNHAKTAEQALAAETQTQKHNADVLGQRLAQAEEGNAQVQGQLSVVTDRLKLTQGEISSAKRQSKQIKNENAKHLAAVESSLASKASADDVKNLSGDVTGVKTDLDATKNSIQMARGELGTLIARNHEEIDQLRRMGQRDYFEFTLDRKGSRQKLGSLTVELRGTNAKRNQYTVALYVDDMRLEKRNRSVNEPIYFYTRGTRAALELVVNQIGKDHVVGYLSVPKSATPASGS